MHAVLERLHMRYLSDCFDVREQLRRKQSLFTIGIAQVIVVFYPCGDPRLNLQRQ